MKFLKKLLFAVLIFFLSVQAINFKAFAENNSHLSLTLSTDSLNTGETLKANVQCQDMCVASFLGSIFYDNELLELVDKSSNGFELEDGKYVNISAEANKESGVVALILIGTTEKKYKANSNVLELTFIAKKQGTAQFYISESSDGPDGCNNEGILAASIEIGENNSTDTNTNSETINSDTEKKIKEIRIATPPTKTEYVTGESFDSTGMAVEIVYEDGSVKVADDYELDQIVVDKKNDQIKISYGDVSTTQKIKVKGNEIEKKNITWLIIIIALLTLIVIFLIIYLQKIKRPTKKTNKENINK